MGRLDKVILLILGLANVLTKLSYCMNNIVNPQIHEW
jgi:hypothetical protein